MNDRAWSRTERFGHYIKALPNFTDRELAQIILNCEPQLGVEADSLVRALGETREALPEMEKTYAWDAAWIQAKRKEFFQPEDTETLDFPEETFEASDTESPDEGKNRFVYLAEDDMVLFHLPGGKICIYSGDEVNRWYQWYSASSDRVKGGLQRNALARKFDIPKRDMFRMLRALNLTKSSPNQAPWVLERHRDHLDALAEASIEKLEDEYMATHELRRNKYFRDGYFKLRDMISRGDHLTRAMQAYSEHIPFERPGIHEHQHLFDRDFKITLASVLSDWHVGAKGFKDRMVVGSPYGSDVRTTRLKQLRGEMAKYRARFRGEITHVYGFILGDMIDDPLSKTFENQAQEQDLYGASQITEAIRSISEHILFHWDLFGCPMTWHLIVGNHGYQFESVLYHWLTDHLKHYEQITLHPVEARYAVVVDPFSDTQIIGLHGDRGVNPQGIGNMLPCDSEHRLILHGHKHHLQVTEVPRGYRVMCPSLMGGNAYSQRFNADSRAGQVMVELHSDGPRPVIYLPVR